MNKLVSVGVVLGLAVVALAGCIGARDVDPPPGSSAVARTSPATSAPIAATAAPSASVTAQTAGPVTDLLTGGRYMFRPIAGKPSLTVVATGPNGWVGHPSWALDGPEPVRADAPTGIGVAFFSASGLYKDACHWDTMGIGDAGQPGDAVVGPTVDDLVAALRANGSYTSTVAKPVTIDGYAGQELEIQLPDDPFTTCDKDDPNDPGGHAFVFSGPGLYAQGPANRWHLYILDVEGTRLVAAILSYAGTPQADLELARNVIDTIDIDS